MRRHWIVIGLILAAVSACAQGKDGKDGNVYGYLTKTTGIATVNFREIGILPDSSGTVYVGRRYQLIPGAATVYWKTTSSSTTYYFNVLIEDGTAGKDAEIGFIGATKDGKNGQDRVYYASLSSNTISWSEDLVTYGTAPATLSAEAQHYGSANPGVDLEAVPAESIPLGPAQQAVELDAVSEEPPR